MDSQKIWAVEYAIKGFHTYYEPLGPPGYSKLENDEERAAYDLVWNKYLFAGLMLVPFSPYIRMVGDSPYPELPFDCTKLDEQGVLVPQEVREFVGYREFLAALEAFALEGLAELRQVNPITRDKLQEEIRSED